MRELRIGLVLYGGVSLAVYMNGVVTELWHLLRASQARQGGDRNALDETAEVYAQLLDALAELTGEDLRVVVDAVAGSSAGGVNGAALAKAVVNGGDAKSLNRVWIEDADIAELGAEPADRAPWYGRGLLAAATPICPKLRNLKAQVEALPGLTWPWVRDHIYAAIRARDGRATVLDGNYFTRMIAKTFAEMTARGTGVSLMPDRASFDLFLTLTDLHGWPRHLPVSEEFHAEPLYERTHAHVMHFRGSPNGRRIDDDFSLTFATRSTAGFPIAFAPVGYHEITMAYRAARPNNIVPTIEDFAGAHLTEHALHDFPVERALMVDGGVLDNKPFSHLARAIERKPADHEVYRTVIYIDPDPETKIDKPANAFPKPLQVGTALYGLLRHEPIYEDLNRLRDRNAKVRDIRTILEADQDNALRAAQEADPALSWPPKPSDAERWRRATNDHAAKYAMSGYPGYVVLKAYSAAYVLADLVCQALRYPYPTRHAYFVRRLVLEWLARRHVLDAPGYDPEKGYVLSADQLALLKAFDVPFCLRRLRALVHATNAAYAELSPSREASLHSRADLDNFKRALADATSAFETAIEPAEDLCRRSLEALGESVLITAVNTAIEANRFNPDSFLVDHAQRLDTAYEFLSGRFDELGKTQNANVAEAIRSLPDSGFETIMRALATFPYVDLIAFPLMSAAGVEDLLHVNVMRISPCDVPELGETRPPLKSLKLGAFAGFLDREAREHDLEWGRLDGAHRLVTLLMAATGCEAGIAEKADDIRQSHLEQLTEAIRGVQAGV